jgi:predicted GIY-YIG superfamily endonuclease
MPWVYILKCADNTFYVGHTGDLESRIRAHEAGFASKHTRLRLPVQLAYSEKHSSRQETIGRERQLKRWSAEKKAALISGDITRLRQSSK